MEERPILMSGEMVRACLRELDPKWQTRRVMKPQPFLSDSKGEMWWFLDRSEDGYGKTNSAWKDGDTPFWTYCPYGEPGDRLWVRETLVRNDKFLGTISYAADGARCTDPTAPDNLDGWSLWKFARPQVPSIHMPRWASRITLEITKVRVERVQEISEEEAKAEGLYCLEGQQGANWPPGSFGYSGIGKGYFHVLRGKSCCCHDGQRLNLQPAICAYRELWDCINSKRGFGWDKNPWVWAIDFRKL